MILSMPMQPKGSLREQPWLHGRKLSSVETWFILIVLLILVAASVYYHPRISNRPSENSGEHTSFPWEINRSKRKTPIMDTQNPYKILFLCTGNSARSVFGEYLIRRIGAGRFESYSAGANPKSNVHPMTIRVLKELYKIDCSEARSKSWDAFKEIEFDFVITVCDNARETCPVWPGQPIIAHWGSPDPVEFTGSEQEQFEFFKQVAMQLQRRIELLSSLPLQKLDRLKLTELTKEIGDKEKLDSEVSYG